MSHLVGGIPIHDFSTFWGSRGRQWALETKLEQDKEAPPTSYWPSNFLYLPIPALPKLPTRIWPKASRVSKGQDEDRGQIFLFQLLFSEYFSLGLVQLNPTLSVRGGCRGTDVVVYLRCLKPWCKKKGLRNKTKGDAVAQSWGI